MWTPRWQFLDCSDRWRDYGTVDIWDAIFVSLGMLESFWNSIYRVRVWFFDISWSWRLHAQVHDWSSHHTWTIETRLSDCVRAQYVAWGAWNCVLQDSANVLSDYCWCEFTVECYSSSRDARSSGCQQLDPWHASQVLDSSWCCIVSSFALLYWDSVAVTGFLCMGRCKRSSLFGRLSDRRLCDNSRRRQIFWDKIRRRYQCDDVTIPQVLEKDR